MLDKRLAVALRFYALKVVGAAAFPRLAYWARWPTRVGWRGLLLYIAFNTAVGVALRTWVFPYFKRQVELGEQVTSELRGELGREPTREEIVDRIVAAHPGSDG